MSDEEYDEVAEGDSVGAKDGIEVGSGVGGKDGFSEGPTEGFEDGVLLSEIINLYEGVKQLTIRD